MRDHMKSRLAATLLLGVSLLAGCASEDRRLVEDRQSCLQMGHSPGTPEFKQCMLDLNDRRCAVLQNRAGISHHVATEDCTRLNSAYSP